MATNVGYEILVDTSISADKKAEIIRTTVQVLEDKTLSITYNTTYSAGTSSTNQATITIGGSSADFGIRVTMDSAVIGTGIVPQILRRLIQVFEAETITISHTASYTAGSRTYNLVIAIS